MHTKRVSLCVCVRERERQTDRQTDRDRERVCVYLFVFVCMGGGRAHHMSFLWHTGQYLIYLGKLRADKVGKGIWGMSLVPGTEEN